MPPELEPTGGPEPEMWQSLDQWMDTQLNDLVAQWIHTAAPNAQRQERISHRFSRQRDTF